MDSVIACAVCDNNGGISDVHPADENGMVVSVFSQSWIKVESGRRG